MNDERNPQEEHWDAQINAMLDGELDAAGVATLEKTARENPELAIALQTARQLQALLRTMPAETAPTGLTRKLLRIPAADAVTGPGFWPWLRGGFALACLALVLVITLPGDPDQPGAEEIEQGRRELALALGYLGRATQQANVQLGSELNDAMITPVTQSTLDTLRQQFVIQQEYLL